MQDGDGFGGRGTSTDIIPLITTRGGPELTISVKTEAWTVLLVDVIGSYDAYRVAVRGAQESADPFWLQDGLTVTYPDALAIGMPGTALAPGNFVLRLEGVRMSAGAQSYEHIQDIPFRTVAAD